MSVPKRNEVYSRYMMMMMKMKVVTAPILAILFLSFG
jgi:hypothetical protein